MASSPSLKSRLCGPSDLKRLLSERPELKAELEEREEEYRVGLWRWRPRFLQVFRNAVTMTVLLFAFATLDGALISGTWVLSVANTAMHAEHCMHERLPSPRGQLASPCQARGGLTLAPAVNRVAVAFIMHAHTILIEGTRRDCPLLCSRQLQALALSPSHVVSFATHARHKHGPGLLKQPRHPS